MIVSKVTGKSQTTLPRGVRQALGINAGDQLGYQINGNEAVIRKVVADEEDPALAPFLALLEQDVAQNAARLEAIPAGLVERIRALTKAVAFNRDEVIHGPVTL